MSSPASQQRDEESESDGERAAAALSPSPALGLLSQERGKSTGKTLGKRKLLDREMKQVTDKVARSKAKHQVFTHGLHLLRHFSCDSPVRYMMYSEAAAAFITLHTDNTARLHRADGRQQSSPSRSAPFPFTGLTSTKLSGCLVGWGPGPIFTLLDSELHHLAAAREPPDIRVCQAAEHSTELVTAGAGNVCVWSAMHMRCKVKIVEGLQRSVFTQMALAPPRSDWPHRAFAVCRGVVTVVDLDAGKVLEHKKNLCLRDITAVVYCSQLDCLIVASQDLSIRVWDPDWEFHMAFVGHNGVVNSMLYCSELGMLISASMDCTIRCWNLEEGDEVQCVHTEEGSPPLYMGATGEGGNFFSFSHQGVDFWTISSLYTLHCKLGGDAGLPLRQILVPPFPAPYPARAVCVSGDSDVTLVAGETGAVLTSFRAKQRILCADYCLHKEILLALTEAGTVLQANTLTNPVMLMEEWRGRGLGPWQQEDSVTEYEAQNLPSPGPAACLVLYSFVAETQRALEEWRDLQEERGHSHRNKAALDDTKNKFLVMLGQSGGCVSVLKLGNGKVLYRTPAHDGQRVTTMQANPENSCLLTTGEDKMLLVWRVDPYAQECLSQHLSLYCGQPLLHLAVLGPRLALAFQEPHSATYSLTHFNLLSRSQADHPPGEDHSDCFTGLCVCPELRVFLSGSLDGTVRIWNKENRLIRTLQLSAQPECMAYSGLGGDLFLGIRGDLYRMNCASLLPQEYQQRLLCTPNSDRVPDWPIIQIKAKHSKRKSASTAMKEEDSKSITDTASNPLSSEDVWRQKEYESLLARDKDLAALLQGTVKCKRRKPPSTEQTQKEAFDRYMKIIYGLPPNIKIGWEDSFDPDALLFSPEPYDEQPCTPPPLAEDFCPDCEVDRPVTSESRKEQPEKPPSPRKQPKPKTPTPPPSPPRTPTPVTPRTPTPVTPRTPTPVTPRTPTPVTPQTPTPVPTRTPTPVPTRTPTPVPTRTPTPVPPRTLTPEMPVFLRQFAEEGWFKDMYPDHRCIPSTLSPEDFSLQLLDYLNTCSAPSKIKIVTALQALHRQELLQNTNKFYKGFIDSVSKHVRPNMSPEERILIVEMLNLFMCLKSDSCDLVISLLTLLAYKKLHLRKTVMCMLTGIGVHEAEQWLCPELESWDSELRDQSNVWKSLHERAEYWLELWISKYKEHSRCQHLRNAAQWKPLTFTMVDVLNYFCSIRKEEYMKARHVAPAGRKDTVLLPQSDCSQPIYRLGENYSMARIRRPPGITLPPLRNRPCLMCFPSFITLPLPRVSLCPFPIRSDQNCLTASPRRYFILQQSYVEYYR